MTCEHVGSCGNFDWWHPTARGGCNLSQDTSRSADDARDDSSSERAVQQRADMALRISKDIEESCEKYGKNVTWGFVIGAFFLQGDTD